MKHFIYTLILGLCTVLVSSCSGTSADDVVMDGKIHMKADKTSIMADGTDCVTFTITRDGEDLSKKESMELELTAEDGTVSTWDSNQFSTTKAGKYSVRAKFYESGYKYSEETIVVTATAIGDSKYKHVLLGMEFTSEGCTFCPAFAEIIKGIEEENPGKMIVVAFHRNFNGVPDFLSIDAADAYLTTFGSLNLGLPQFAFNIRKPEKMMNTRDPVIKAMAAEMAIPNTCGVAVDTRYDAASRKLNVTAKITSDVESQYKYVVYLVEDNIEPVMQANAGPGFLHQNAVRAVLTSPAGDRFPSEYRPVPANQEVAIALPEVVIPDGWNTDNMRVVVSMLNSLDGGKSYTSNNTTQCKLGESADYLLNE